MEPKHATIRTDVESGVATITLDRPQALNAFERTMVEALWEALKRVSRDPSVRAVILTGSGRAFCAGGDLRASLAEHPERPGTYFHALAAVFHQCVTELRRMDAPVIAALNGPAAGGGFSMALACDLRVMAEGAFLQQAYTSSGLCIDGGGTYTLPRLVGLARALEIALLDERIPAERALSLGLVHRVVPADRVLAEALSLAARLVEMPTATLGRVKRLLDRSFHTPFETQLEDERRELTAAADSPEGREGLRAFVDKRPPDFRSPRP